MKKSNFILLKTLTAVLSMSAAVLMTVASCSKMSDSTAAENQGLSESTKIGSSDAGLAMRLTEVPDGDITIEVLYKSGAGLKTISFDMTLPEGIYFIDDAEWDKNNIVSALTAECTGTPSLVCSPGKGDEDHPQTATITVNGAYTAKSRKYVNLSDEYTSLCTITACVMTQDDIDTYEWEEDIADIIGNVKITNGNFTDIDGKETSNLEYTASFICAVDENCSISETELCGYIDDENKEEVQVAVNKVAGIDISGLEVKDGTSIPIYSGELKSYGYATFSSNVNVSYPKGAIVYKGKVSDKSLILTEISDGYIPAGTGILLQGTEGASYSFDLALDGSAADVSENDLLPTTTTEALIVNPPAEGDTWILNDGAFKKFGNQINYFTQNRAYIHAEEAMAMSSKMQFTFSEK